MYKINRWNDCTVAYLIGTWYIFQGRIIIKGASTAAN